MTEAAATQQFSLKRAYYPRAAILRATGTFGKDVLRTSRTSFAIGAMFVLLWMVLALRQKFTTPALTDLRPLFQVYLLLAAYVIGLILAGEEEDTDARFFLDRLPTPRAHLLVAKIGAGIFAWFLSVLSLGIVFAIQSDFGNPWPFIHNAMLQFSRDGASPIVGWLSAGKGASWCVALFATGLALGSLTRRNLLGVGLLGFMVALGWLQLLFAAMMISGQQAAKFEPWLKPLLVFANGYLDVLGLGVWSAVAFYIAARRFATRRESGGEPLTIARLRAMLPWKSASDSVTRYILNMAHRDVRTWGICYVVVIAAVSWVVLPTNFSKCAWQMAFPISFILPLIYGVLARPSCEMDGASFFLHAIPINPRAHLRQRLFRMAEWTLFGTVLAWLIAAFVGFSDSDAVGKMGGPEEWEFFKAVFLIHAGGGVVCAWLGYFCRGFFRGPVIALVTVILLAIPWACAWFAVFLTNSWLLPWTIFASLLVSAGAIWIADRHSLLSELNDGSRVAAWCFAALNLTIWGPFFMTMSPRDLIRIIF